MYGRCPASRTPLSHGADGADGADGALRYLRDRISVPRDMSIYAAKRLKQALESTAALVGDRPGTPIPIDHRRDQNPVNFAAS